MRESVVFWKEYLNQYCSVEGYTGLTIPNIVGSVIIHTSFKKYSINNFINEVREENFEILISYCPDENEIVFGNFTQWIPKTYYENIGSIYFDNKDFQLPIRTIDQLINQLEKKYNCKIKNKTFSKENNSDRWVYLTEEDKHRHKKVISNLRFK